jgi:hypothetical protein
MHQFTMCCLLVFHAISDGVLWDMELHNCNNNNTSINNLVYLHNHRCRISSTDLLSMRMPVPVGLSKIISGLTFQIRSLAQITASQERWTLLNLYSFCNAVKYL